MTKNAAPGGGKLLFSVPGLPLGDGTRKFNYESGIRYLSGLGLDGMELMFVRSVTVTDKNREGIQRAAVERGMYLSAHGSYYVNLNAKDPEIVEKSLERIVKGAKALLAAGGKRLVFHPGFYLDSQPEEAYLAIAGNLARLPDLGVEYRLETTGKPTQFGTLPELVRLSREIPACRPCIDFAHIHARDNGCLKTYGDFAAILEYIARELGDDSLKDLHIHMADIRYGVKGEISHLKLGEGDFPYEICLKALYDYGAGGVVVAESPVLEHDALILKGIYESF